MQIHGADISLNCGAYVTWRDKRSYLVFSASYIKRVCPLTVILRQLRKLDQRYTLKIGDYNKMFLKVLFLLLTVAYNFHITTAVYGEIEIECENDTCTKCYKTLATELLKNADNYIALQSTFFPPDDSGPDFVIVTYVFDDRHNSVNETTDETGSASQNLNGHIWFDEQYNIDLIKNESASQNLSNHIWFWSSSAYFFYHPLRVIQFTSLGFSDPYMKQRSILLRLPASCYYSESNGDRGPFNMKLLTQRVRCKILIIVNMSIH